MAAVAGCTLFEPAGQVAGPAVPVVRDAGPTVPAKGTYRLQPGDTISVFVFDNSELSQNAVIAPDGRLNYPLAGTIQARGQTLNAIESILTQRFSKNIVSPQVSVSLVSMAPYRIFVTGEVIQPGAFDLAEPVTLVQALTLAGGFTAFAERSRILVYNPARRGNARRVFDYDRFISDPQAQDILLWPGDTIIVE